MAFFPALFLVFLFSQKKFRESRTKNLKHLSTNKIPELFEIKRTNTLKSKIKNKLLFPWWFIFFSYMLSFTVMVLSIIFTYIKGFNFFYFELIQSTSSFEISFLGILYHSLRTLRTYELYTLLTSLTKFNFI